MGRRRSAWVALAVLVVSGCTYTPLPAESTAAACVNGKDDDRDGYTNCEDSDCWAFAVCRGRADAGLGPSMPPDPPTDIPSDNGPLDPPNDSTADGSAPTDMPAPEDASAPSDASDAAPDAALVPCNKYCPDEACNDDGTCGSPLQFGTFDITAIKTVVPAKPETGCYDYCFEAPGGCCLPDPIVVVEVDGVKLGSVGGKIDEETSTWESTGLKITLAEGTVVELEALDSDLIELNMVQWLYNCTLVVSEATIEAGVMRCTADDPALYIAATIAPMAEVLADEGPDDDEDAQGDMP